MTKTGCIILLTALLALGAMGQDIESSSFKTDQIEVDKPSKSVYLKINPLAILASPIWLAGEYRLGLEFVGAKNITYEVSASYINKSPLFNLLYEDTTTSVSNSDLEFPGYRLQAQVKYFYLKFNRQDKLSKIMIPNGLYVSLHSSYATAAFKFKARAQPRIEFSNFYVDALGGIQVLYSDAVGLDVFFGLGYKKNTIVEVDQYGRTSSLNPADLGLGGFYTSPIKVSLGFNLAFGLF